ncbi:MULTISPECIES: P1 family peptidase [Inquilinus]|uniref:L-aminopeptidase/D-esterase-like protein n=1 Tax=Inquilinus ginsengisoli TaxID=363840 RepID=A0ABU1JVE2_9PROT|nr:P1 family peptidase [Inquilinus ginsengisoli]MDR6292600.1 L-aminopeptidase/D-esterase-like protein [Inquilinus ginsengisoli]
MTIRPGPRNAITDIAGLRVGQAEDLAARTGVTVLLPEMRCVAGVDVRGGGPGTRETDALDPTCMVEAVDALVLAGGSVYGLDAASGVVSWLAARGRGLPVAGLHVPIVPGAILFDLANGGDKSWGDTPPYRALALAACDAAGTEVRQGNAGAGTGAKTATCKGGLGTASAVDPETGITVGALVAANPVGAVTMPDGTFWAWPWEQDSEFGGPHRPTGPASPEPEFFRHPAAAPAVGTASPQPDLGGNTTIGIVAVDAILTKAEAQRVAIMAQDGLARAIRPVHTPMDGDTIFALATGARALPEPRAVALARIGAIAADCVARAIARGVWHAETLGPHPAWRERWGAAKP